MALLLIVALAAVPALSTAAPLDCRVRPFKEPDYLVAQERFIQEMQKEGVLPSPIPSGMVSGSDIYMPDGVKVGFVPPMGVEVLAPPGCPDISD
ncbi:hypothetical protein OG589_33860 [Sphaerisporangium sp. NBC_01403]|uniref:hypothetical protein n=1 Tax=Sphaerisporangium sp. NBC_01403 TaxID=2903599 RepID=UPI00324BC1E7